MKLARYWARAHAEARDRSGYDIRVTARGWSNDGEMFARAKAAEVAKRVAQRLAGPPELKKQYEYGDRPLPEPVLREFGPTAVVTRNSYGALILNTSDLMFVDIDRTDGKVMDLIRTVSAVHGLAARIYRTAAGFRVLITDRAIPATSPQAGDLLREFGADPLYIRLCRAQESFRARLTPKPWRCGHCVPPVSFPYETARDLALQQEWEKEYERESRDYATCAYLSMAGGVRIDAALEPLVAYHDEVTRAVSRLDLA